MSECFFLFFLDLLDGPLTFKALSYFLRLKFCFTSWESVLEGQVLDGQVFFFGVGGQAEHHSTYYITHKYFTTYLQNYRALKTTYSTIITAKT